MLSKQELERELEPRPWRRAALRAYGSLRMAVASASKVGLAPQPRHPQGITALVRVKNEPHTIEASLRSVADFVEEFVVVDASTDETTQIVGDAARRYGLPLVHFSTATGPGMSTGAQHAADSQRGLEMCNRRWVLRWDADLIARRAGPWGFPVFRERLLALDERLHYVVHVPLVRLVGDLRHVDPRVRLQREGWAFTNSESLRYEDQGRFEMLRLPWYYARLRWVEPCAFHLADYKPDRRLFLRKYWTEWRGRGDRRRWPDLEGYALERARERWPGVDEHEAVRRTVEDYVRTLVPYPEDDFGPLPEEILELERQGGFRIVEVGGVPSGRIETPRQRS